MKILFLDDEQIRHDRFEKALASRVGEYNLSHVFTAERAIKELKASTIGSWKDITFFDEIWLDHDLGPDDKESGMKVVNFLVEHPEHKNHGEIFIHSLNPICSKEMMLRLRDAGYNVSRIVPP